MSANLQENQLITNNRQCLHCTLFAKQHIQSSEWFGDV